MKWTQRNRRRIESAEKAATEAARRRRETESRWPLVLGYAAWAGEVRDANHLTDTFIRGLRKGRP